MKKRRQLQAELDPTTSDVEQEFTSAALLQDDYVIQPQTTLIVNGKRAMQMQRHQTSQLKLDSELAEQLVTAMIDKAVESGQCDVEYKIVKRTAAI